MRSSPVPLPSDPRQLQKICTQLQRQLADQDRVIESQQKTLDDHASALQAKQDTIDYLTEQLVLLRSKRYQAQSEQLKTLQGQLFDEAELEVAIREAEAALAELHTDLVPTPESERPPAKARPKRKPIPEHLKRVDIVIDVSDADKQMMGDDWILVGYEVSEQLAVQQRTYYVKRFKRAKYVRNESSAESTGGIKVAPRPAVMLPKAIADSSLLADIIAAKFVDALSFYRTDKILQREGIDIGYSTLCDWPIQLSERLAPLQVLMFEAVRDSELWHLDDDCRMQEVEQCRSNCRNDVAGIA